MDRQTDGYRQINRQTDNRILDRLAYLGRGSGELKTKAKRGF